MPRLIAFLRAINVGGHNVKMEDLRQLFEELGFTRVETFIASGNVIFETRARDTGALQKKIEDHLRAALGYEVGTFLRTDAEVAAVARYEAFSTSQREEAAALNVAFLAQTLSSDAVGSLMKLKTELDDFHVNGREVYWLCRQKQSESTFSNAVFEKTLKVRATFRGMTTIARLAAKYVVPRETEPRKRGVRR